MHSRSDDLVMSGEKREIILEEARTTNGFGPTTFEHHHVFSGGFHLLCCFRSLWVYWLENMYRTHVLKLFEGENSENVWRVSENWNEKQLEMRIFELKYLTSCNQNRWEDEFYHCYFVAIVLMLPMQLFCEIMHLLHLLMTNDSQQSRRGSVLFKVSIQNFCFFMISTNDMSTYKFNYASSFKWDHCTFTSWNLYQNAIEISIQIGEQHINFSLLTNDEMTPPATI